MLQSLAVADAKRAADDSALPARDCCCCVPLQLKRFPVLRPLIRLMKVFFKVVSSNALRGLRGCEEAEKQAWLETKDSAQPRGLKVERERGYALRRSGVLVTPTREEWDPTCFSAWRCCTSSSRPSFTPPPRRAACCSRTCCLAFSISTASSGTTSYGEAGEKGPCGVQCRLLSQSAAQLSVAGEFGVSLCSVRGAGHIFQKRRSILYDPNKECRLCMESPLVSLAFVSRCACLTTARARYRVGK